jgi:hypothetical protein
MRRKDIPIPETMQELPRDKRGLPVPFTILFDKFGEPNFKINDSRKELECVAKHNCSICGKPMSKNDMWFVGGALSAWHPAGAFNDAPAHELCTQYALQVCPYLSNNSYSGGNIIVDESKYQGVQGFINPTQSTARLKFFVMVKAKSFTINLQSKTYRPERPYVAEQLWSEGKQITRAQAAELLKQK